MYQSTKMEFKNALFFGFFQNIKSRNLRALLIRSESALLGNIFIDFCCTCDTKQTCKRLLKYIKSSFSESDLKMHKFSAEFNGGRSAKTAILISLDFSKSKTLWAVLVLFSKIVHQRVSLGKI